MAGALQAAKGGRGAAHPLALKEGLAVLVDLQLGDDHLRGVQADVHRGAIHLRRDSGLTIPESIDIDNMCFCRQMMNYSGVSQKAASGHQTPMKLDLSFVKAASLQVAMLGQLQAVDG